MKKQINGSTATVSYGDKTAEMGTPEAEEIITEMLKNMNPGLRGGSMAGINIKLERVEGLDIKFKKDSDILALETHLSSEDVARLHNLSKLGMPIQVMITSPQAEMDLRIEKVNATTGELWAPKFKPDARD
jgi:hypothetical protein